MSSEAPTLLMLGGANPNVASMCISQARARGLKIWVTDTEENLKHAPALVKEVDRVTALPYNDPDACVAWSIEQAKTTSFVGVFGSREFAVEAVAAVAESLGLPGNPLRAVRLVRNKQACREALRRLGFPQPAVALCSTLEEARTFISEHPTGSWIIKPPAATGSTGVCQIHSGDDLEEALVYLKESCNALDQNLKGRGVIEESVAYSAHAPFLIECFQEGEEYSAEGVFVYNQPHVLAVTSKVTLGAPHFVEVGHAMPAELAPDILQVVKETVESALLALDLSWGQFHVEFWLDGKQVVLGELHVRAGGDQLHFMTQYVTGIELYGVLFDQMLGRTVDIAQYQPSRGVAIRFLTFPPGHVTSISGWEAVTTNASCLKAELNLKVGDHVGSVYSSLDRRGFIVASGETTTEAIQNAERLVTTVQVGMEEVLIG